MNVFVVEQAIREREIRIHRTEASGGNMHDATWFLDDDVLL